jgi:hypothetical protein
MSRVRSCSAVDKSPAMHALQVVVMMAKIYDMRHTQIALSESALVMEWH